MVERAKPAIAHCFPSFWMQVEAVAIKLVMKCSLISGYNDPVRVKGLGLTACNDLQIILKAGP